MPNHPLQTPFITDLRAKGLDIPSDAIVVRGYLGPPTGVLEHADAILSAFGKSIPASHIKTVNDFTGVPLGGDGKPAPPTGVDYDKLQWRIYLTARLDCWVEVPDWGTNVIHVQPEQNTDRLQAFTVWLRRHTDKERCCPIRYRVVREGKLEKTDDFIAGRLVHDYMTRSESSNVVWEEQEYGPQPTTASLKHCF
jgi:hypothetical protein